MKALNERDVSIDYAFMVTVEKFMRHGCENVPDYMLSGSRGDFTGVGDIHFFYSADEVLYGALPDFEEACKRANVPYTVSARPKMVHCYCMLPIFKEAKEDFASMELLHARLIRTNTCVDGCRCDYTICGDKDPYLKGHPEYRDKAGFRRNR